MIPAIDTEIEFTSGSRKGCRGKVIKNVGRHGYFVVKLTYAPRDSDYRKGEDLHTTASHPFEIRS